MADCYYSYVDYSLMFNLVIGMFCAFSGGMFLGSLSVAQLKLWQTILAIAFVILIFFVAYVNVMLGLQSV